MAISFDNALGIHQQALLVRAERAEVLANNIINADTPNYQARDLDFKAILAGQRSGSSVLPMEKTSANHHGGIINPEYAADLMYRNPLQPSIDGNTVDVQTEQAEYARNALDFQTSFTLLNRKFTGLLKAIKGE
ncbi:flagellar basal body rod protein FlgB [Motiliproteus sp. MSK22-1]|uniref:flagellar basal body rod protein FlgB n=1 Tax=Motiliproteus sp. MSK22-1 TaxID=1897630 RepID=UPI000976F5B5|nr:flagellar basal body rod protein FlgB [Motiliproteus sp. MSK22-1]OMH30001.1 flagellar basal-body rod protein FlgB [Motiliproteus sp. MSK22-1]